MRSFLSGLGKVLLGIAFVLAVTVTGLYLWPDQPTYKILVLLLGLPLAYKGWTTTRKWWLKAPVLFIVAIIPIVSWVMVY